MKHFLITYHLKDGLQERRREEIVAFIAALDAEPALKGRISYRCWKARDGSDYYHLATAADDDAVKALQSQDFFKRYTGQTDSAAAGEVDVVPLEIIAESGSRLD